MWWNIGKIGFHRLIVLLVLKPTGTTSSTDCSVGYGLVANIGLLRELSSWPISWQDIPQLSPFQPNPIPDPTPPIVRVTFLVFASFSLLTSKSKENEKLWLSCLHLHVILTPYGNLSSLNKYLDHSFFLQKRNTTFAERQFLIRIDIVFLGKCFKNRFQKPCSLHLPLEAFLK